MKQEDYFLETDLQVNRDETKSFSFTRKWGIPVRFHDVAVMLPEFHPDFMEFHLSADDVKKGIVPKDLPRDFQFTVHLPDAWENNFLINFCSDDLKTLNKSQDYFRNTAKLMRKLIKENSLLQKSFKVIVHPGGFSEDTPVTNPEEIARQYSTLANAINKVQEEYRDAEILLENMPPLPWLIGGQRFSNIFTKSSDIIQFLKKTKLKMCLDLSHASLYCQYSGEEFYEYISKLSPFTSHLHISDASGIDGEGLEVGAGELNFEELGKILKEKCPKASFIPEIWQGHYENGKNFKKSLKALMGTGKY